MIFQEIFPFYPEANLDVIRSILGRMGRDSHLCCFWRDKTLELYQLLRMKY